MYILKEGSSDKDYRMKYKMKTTVAILPIGLVDIKSGKNKVVDNIYSTWQDDDSVSEIWDTGTKKVIIITSGNKPLFKVGESKSFRHDQNLRDLFYATLVDWCDLKDLPKMTRYGPKLSAYVYK